MPVPADVVARRDAPSPRSLAAVNEEIRRFTAGRVVWPPEALPALALLWAEYEAARAREAELAA